MRENRVLIVLFVFVILLAGVFGWLYIQLTNPDIFSGKTTQTNNEKVLNPAYPFFPANSETYLDAEKTWQRKAFQPIYEGFSEASMEGYLRISYVASPEGTTREGKVYVGGQISYLDETNKAVMIDSKKLKDLLKKGDQFGVEYLSQIPANFSLKIPRCSDQTKRPVECILASFKKISDKNMENIFYPFFIYRVLRP